MGARGYAERRDGRGRPPLTFEVIPAIDLRGGRCVRLYQGDYARETRYPGDPVEIALRWQELGAPRLHVVDLDGAKDGSPANHEAMAAICAAVRVPVEVSGGIRTEEDLERALAFGATRVQLGSIAVSNPAFVADAVTGHPEAIVVSIDARAGEIYTHGWLKATGVSALAFAGEMVRAVAVPVIAAGGVSSVEHLPRLAAIGCEGAIIGKALYEGAIDLRAALAAVD